MDALSMYDPQLGWGDYFDDDFVPEPPRAYWEHDQDALDALGEGDD